MIAFLRCLEGSAEKSELTLGNLNLGHGETDAELGSSDETGSESIEVTEELKDADSLLLGEDADASNNIIDIVGVVAHNLRFGLASLSLGDVVSAVVVTLGDSKELLSSIDILAEIDVVYLVDITLVHVTAEDLSHDLLRS